MLPLDPTFRSNEARHEMNLLTREDQDLLELFAEGPSNENIDLSDWSFTKTDAAIILRDLNLRP